jgi:hypothetical protein
VQAFCTKGTSRECKLRNGDSGVPWDMCGTKSVRETGATAESDCQGFCDAETGRSFLCLRASLFLFIRRVV